MRTVPGPTDHVVVVGAGLAGLSATLHLLGAGRRVTVLERAAEPGGRCGRLTLGGYRIDTGPTVLTMPELVEDALAAVGATLGEHLDLVPLHPAYRARFADGSTLDVHTDPEAMAAEVRRLAGPREEDGYRRLRAWLTRLYRVQADTFIGANFDSPLDLLTPRLARLVALGGFGRLDAAVGRFLRDPRLRRVFTFQSLYAGLAPHRALAAYAVIAYMDTVAGVYFPRGGMHALPRALAAAATGAGAEIRYGRTATALERRGDRIIAVRTADGDRLPCDAVVLTPDLPAAYRLLGGRPRRPFPVRWSPSAVVLHTGSTGSWPDLAHHTISFGTAWRRTFAEITRHGRLMSDPSLLVSTPTLTEPGLAPVGRQLHYVLAPAPNLATGPIDWSRLGPAYRDELVRTLERRSLPGLGAAIDAEYLVTPADWAAAGHPAGTPFSAAHTFAQTGPFRPANLVAGTSNAVLAGCGTTPGVGIPPVLISGRLAAQRITGPVAARANAGAIR
ncbi:phytoene desaturase family protein [Gandjariella thermophila]|uniref:Phytoene dehydrogenase n=1 Tax=Gandjariella thermophila TaxID=1931992 RepID=A0A4D4IWZ0_9PSEU|nr:phytoene desaturase family protein [Gandjariella thermophila]GDY28711.1 phytoene dehydrogenase [Gandjariella thermophila]